MIARFELCRAGGCSRLLSCWLRCGAVGVLAAGGFACAAVVVEAGSDRR